MFLTIDVGIKNLALCVMNFQNKKKLHQKYINRWQRAVLKYKLPAMLNLDPVIKE